MAYGFKWQVARKVNMNSGIVLGSFISLYAQDEVTPAMGNVIEKALGKAQADLHFSADTGLIESVDIEVTEIDTGFSRTYRLQRIA